MKQPIKSKNKIYEKTGTLAPLIDDREYTDNEKIVLLHFFTNIDKNVYCVTDAMSSQLYAFLVGQYSRSATSMRNRFLQLFEDAEKAYNNKQITKDEYVSLDDLADAIKDRQFKTIKYFNDRAAGFLKKWGVTHGHNSLKDADRIRFAIEGISEVYTNIIESPFPPLGDFQEKSTRYMNFTRESIIYSPVLKKSKFHLKIKQYMEDLLDLYKKYLPIVRKSLVKNKIINQDEFKSKRAFENTLNAKTFDIIRYLLPSSMTTSLGCAFSARTTESHISEMLSHHLKEVRLVAKSMYKEAIKISPGLLTHVKKNDYFISKRKKTIELTDKIFDKTKNKKIIKGITDKERVGLISCDNLDNLIVASILFENGRRRGLSFKKCLREVLKMSESDKEKIMEAEIGNRGQFDRMPRSILHGSILFEFLTDFGCHRDIMRHRASPQVYQGVTAIHGYDYPEYIDLPGMEEFKKDYNEIMTKITILAREVIKKYPYEIEYVAALGHLLRTTYEMHPGQIAYVCELRTTPQGHYSYVNLFRQVYRIVQKKAPIFAKFIRVDLEQKDNSRKAQEEKSAERRKKMGIED